MRVASNPSLWCLIIIIFAFGSPTAAQSLKRAEDYYNRGLDRQDAGDIDGALADYVRRVRRKTA